MLLSYVELRGLAERGVVTDVQDDAINAASIDVRLGREIMVEDLDVCRNRYSGQTCRVVDLSKRESLSMRRIRILGEGGYRLNPGQFILAHTMEMFNLPNDISAQFLLKSSMARAGLDHLSATWCDAGWHGSRLTLELRNVTESHILLLKPGMFIGQMKFYRHTPVPDDKSYAARGRYNNDETVAGIKE